MTIDKKATDHSETWDDPIVAEVRAARDSIAAQLGYDVDRIVEHVSAWRKEWRWRSADTTRLPRKAK